MDNVSNIKPDAFREPEITRAPFPAVNVQPPHETESRVSDGYTKSELTVNNDAVFSYTTTFTGSTGPIIGGAGFETPKTETPLPEEKKEAPVDKQSDPSSLEYQLNMPGVTATTSKGCSTITIFYTNDIHGMLRPSNQGEGGMERLSGVLNQLREQNPNNILVDGGDIAYRLPHSDLYRFSPMPEVMNVIGYTALGPGNHEWQWEGDQYGGVNGNPNPELVDNLRELSQALNFPMVNCNTRLEATGERPDFMKPFVIEKIGDVNVGITGIVTPEMRTRAHKNVGENWAVDNPATALQETIPKMKEAGADVVVVLSHESIEDNQEIIAQTSGIDIMIGSHDHKLTQEPLLTKDADGREVPLVEAMCGGRFVGQLDVTLNPEDKQITGIQAQMHPVLGKEAKAKADPEVISLVKEWAKKMEAAVEQNKQKEH